MTAWKEQFKTYAQQLLDEAKVPGAAIAFARNGELLYEGTFGFRDREQHLPLSLDTVFGIASITKSFTCVAIMQLHEAGKLSVHDPVVKHLPEFRAGDYELTARMTIHHFMTHTPGIAPMPYLDGAMRRSMENDPAVIGTKAEEELKTVPYLDTYEEVMEAIAGFKEKPLSEPGGAFSYNNDAYGLLGAIVERVSNQTYEDYVATHILQPLGMDRTVFSVDELADKDDVTILYTNKKIDDENQIIAAPIWHDAPAMRAAGFLKSTVNDLLTYLEVFRLGATGDPTPILSADSVRQMLTPFARVDGHRSYGYGLMVSSGFPDGLLVEHGGSLKGISSHIFSIPDQGITGVILVNLDGVSVRELVLGFLNSYFARLAGAPLYDYDPYELADEELSLYEGHYSSQEWVSASIVKSEGKLVLEVDGLSYPLIPVQKDSFVFKKRDAIPWIEFFRDEDGQVVRMSYGLRQLTRESAKLQS
ncbi:serine hydrolase domain-containing protein [Brevibacillus fortis]|uniref:Penicillin-binding protein n=1 Tax=Brevibacillus fortis TaxID=2126352 RepID=A0A2P7V4T6_9BACL|nr:serine hydrolase domain-containing protein [Brevibacillus fortis]PSJ94209.1 penicillin-binding protein [Brevibacillus fortis]